MKQVYEYYRQVYCKEKTDVIAIIISISKYGKIKELEDFDITYHPRIIKTKNINKQKDLKIIRDKFKHNEVLTSRQCSLLTAFPIFDLEDSEEEIVEEICKHIQSNKDCIPDGELEGIIMGMYLNSLEYIPVERHEELMEMIDMATTTEGVIAKMKREERDLGISQGISQGQKDIILELLKTNSLKTISEMINKSESEILDIIKAD